MGGIPWFFVSLCPRGGTHLLRRTMGSRERYGLRSSAPMSKPAPIGRRKRNRAMWRKQRRETV